MNDTSYLLYEQDYEIDFAADADIGIGQIASPHGITS